MNTVNAGFSTKQRRFDLEEGSLIVRALLPGEVDQLRKIEDENKSDSAKSLSRYMVLIEAAVCRLATWSDARIPADMKQLDWILGDTSSDYRELWAIVRALYELTGLEIPAELPSHV